MMIKDEHFRVELDRKSSSPDPQTAIWQGQHQCVSEDFAFDEKPPSEARCGEIIIKHQLAGDRGHFSVLRKAFVSFSCAGFPHSVVSQISRHQDSSFLVQSGRYTGERICQVARGERNTEEVFYFRPVGVYIDRKGNRYEYTEGDREYDISECESACTDYERKISKNCPYEMARDLIPYNFRQNFEISCDLQACWHWIDQRSKADSQLEIRTLSEMVMQKLEVFTPELSAWYRSNRYGRGKLAP